MINGKWCSTKERVYEMRKKFAAAGPRVWTVFWPKSQKSSMFYVGPAIPDYIQAKIETGFVAVREWK